MLYLYLSDEEISLIQTSKNILGKESIVAAAHKQLPSALVVEGVIKDPALLTVQLNELFTSAYPKAIKDKEISLVISDQKIINQRFSIPKSEKKEDFMLHVSEEAKKVIPQDTESLIKFAKTISTAADREDVYFTAITKTDALAYSQFFDSLGLKLIFLSSKSLVLYPFMKTLLNQKENLLYLDLWQESAEYYFFDIFGLISFNQEKITAKIIASKLKTKIGQWQKEKGLMIEKIIIGGNKSIEFQSSELAETLKIPVQKIGEIFENIIKSQKINFDSGGIAQLYFVQPIALFLYSKTSSPANFIEEDKSKVLKKAPVVISIESPPEISEKEKTNVETILPEQSQVLPGEITEHKGFSISQMFSKKILLILFFLIFFLGAFTLFFIGMGGKANMNLLTKPVPTITPTPTVLPTATPTPTIDLKLKRSDLKISIQNGTDKSGFAKETADYLEKKGYKNIAKSNADKDTYEKTIIRIKKDKENYLPLIISDLTDKFDTSTKEELGKGESFDCIIILGKK